jgi:hypothetical protein
MAGKNVPLSWYMQAGLYQSPQQTINIDLVTGCDQSVIEISTIELIKATIG